MITVNKKFFHRLITINCVMCNHNRSIPQVSEVRRVEDGSRHTQVLLRATPDRMIGQLGEDTNPADPNYIEDFLLCHRVFLESSLLVVQQLLDWFERTDLRDKAGGSRRFSCY